jgi:hypothetical protein
MLCFFIHSTMKKYYFVTLGILFLSLSNAQVLNPLDYSNIDFSDLKTTTFIKNTSPFTLLGKQVTSNSMFAYTQTLKELQQNNTTINYNEVILHQKTSNTSTYGKEVTIGLIHANFETLNDNQLANESITLENNSVKRLSQEYIFNKESITIISPLTVIKKGLETHFVLKSSFFYNDHETAIASIHVNFDNDSGFQEIVFDEPVLINYSTAGTKNLTFIITLANGDTLERHATLNVMYNRNDRQTLFNSAITDLISSVTADLSNYTGAENFSGLGEYEIFLGADGVLNKPIILVDGFDPGDTRDITGIYSMLDYDDGTTVINLATALRNDEDFDIIVVNFPSYLRLADGTLLSLDLAVDNNNDGVIDTNDYDGSTLIDGGVDFIERNAMLVLDVLNIVNTSKTSDADENIVIGPSMGGLITRYALNYMESQNIDHDTRLWISFDSPHLGANVPIGFQHLFNYLAYSLDTWVGDFSIEALKPIVDGMLKSPAARQMLVDHFEAHLAGGSIGDFDPSKLLPEPHPYHTSFYSEINSLTSSGFPEETRKISLANGSGTGATFPDIDGNAILPGRRVLDAFIPNVALLTDATLKAWYTTYASEQKKISKVIIDAPFLCFCDITTQEEARSPGHTDGIDAAPGGLFDIAKLGEGFDSSDPTINTFFDSLETDYFNFIPTVSALALSTNTLAQWYQDINLGAGDAPWDDTLTTHPETPFDNWYIPSDNEAHVSLTNNNLNFLFNEIIRPYVTVSPKFFLQGALSNSNGTLMRDDLRTANLIPTTTPYNDIATTNTNVLSTSGNDAIVDWVTVSIRDKNDASQILNSTSALLQADGDVVGTDGSSPVKILSPPDDYFLSVSHRNHLSASSKNTLTLDKNNSIINFSNNSIATYGNNALKQMPSGLLALWLGDVDQNKTIKFSGTINDLDTIKDNIMAAPSNIFSSISYTYEGYLNTDTDLNGNSKFTGANNDSNLVKDTILSHPGNIFDSISYVILEQLPN